jgi:hypothetical protein
MKSLEKNESAVPIYMNSNTRNTSTSTKSNSSSGNRSSSTGNTGTGSGVKGGNRAVGTTVRSSGPSFSPSSKGSSNRGRN